MATPSFRRKPGSRRICRNPILCNIGREKIPACAGMTSMTLTLITDTNNIFDGVSFRHYTCHDEDHKWVFYTATDYDIYVVADDSYWTCVDGPDCCYDEIPCELWRGT